MAENPSDLTRGRYILGVGEVPKLEAPSVERKLAAILAADVAGYSRLMGADEEGTHGRLKAHLGELVNPKIAEYRGRIVKNVGDGFLAEFASVVDAVRCAVEVQRASATPISCLSGKPPQAAGVERYLEDVDAARGQLQRVLDRLGEERAHRNGAGLTHPFDAQLVVGRGRDVVANFNPRDFARGRQ